MNNDVNPTAKKTNKKDRKKGCYHCGSSDHRAKQCPNELPCRLCQSVDHNMAACPANPSPSSSTRSGRSSVVDMGSFQHQYDFHNLYTKFRYVELFAGIGGFRVALDRLGGCCVFASEMDRFAKRNYELNHGDRPAGDITQILVKDESNEREQSIIPDHDLLVGGFPCQSFSSSGNRKGFDDPRGVLFLEIVGILKRKQPKAVLLENVRGLVTHEEGKTLGTIVSELEGVGYDVHWKVLDAMNIVPQERKRVYIAGVRKNLRWGPYQFPEIPIFHRGFSDIVESDMGPETIERLSLSERQLLKVKCQNYTKKFPAARFLSDMNSPTKTLQSSYASYMVNSQFVACCSNSSSDIRGNEMTMTATTTQWRRLSPREAARLQGFPESFQLCLERPYRLLGNAVVPSMIAWVVSPMLPLLDPSLKEDPLMHGQKVALELLVEASPDDDRAERLRSKIYRYLNGEDS